MNKQFEIDREQMLLKRFIVQNNNYFGIGLEPNEIEGIAQQILAFKYTNIQENTRSTAKRKPTSDNSLSPQVPNIRERE